MHQYVNSFGHKEFSFPLKSLVEFMLEYREAYGRHCTWFQATGNIYSLVANFLRTKDCFIQHQQSHCSLDVHLYTSIQSVKSKEPCTGRPSLDSVSSIPGQVLRITAEVLSTGHRLSCAISADNKIGYIFEPPLLDEACRHVPQTTDISSFGWEPQNVAVTVNRLFPGPVKFELAFRVKVRHGLCYPDIDRPLPQVVASSVGRSKLRSTESTCSRRDSMFSDVHGLDGSASSRAYDTSTAGSCLFPQRLRRDRQFFTDCFDLSVESASPLEDQPNRHFWTETGCSQLEQDAQDLYPRLYETYGDARIHKFSTLRPQKTFIDVDSYPCRCPPHTLHPMPMHDGSWGRRRSNCQTARRLPRFAPLRYSDDSDSVPQSYRHMARHHAMFCSDEETHWQPSPSRQQKDKLVDDETARESSLPRPRTPPNPRISPATPPKDELSPEAVLTSGNTNDVQESSPEGIVGETEFPFTPSRCSQWREELRGRLNENTSTIPASADDGQQNAADQLWDRGTDSISVPGKQGISQPFINTVLVDTPQTCLPLRFKIRGVHQQRQPSTNSKMGLDLRVETADKSEKTHDCLVASDICSIRVTNTKSSASSDASDDRGSLSSLTSPKWRAPRKTYRPRVRLADNRSTMTVRNFFDVLRSPEPSENVTIDLESPTCESDKCNPKWETEFEGREPECLSTVSKQQITENVHDQRAIERGKRKRSLEDAVNEDVHISSQASTSSDITDGFELEADWDKYGTLGVARPIQQLGPLDALASNVSVGNGPSSAMPDMSGSGSPASPTPANTISARGSSCTAAASPTPALRKRRAFRRDTPQRVDAGRPPTPWGTRAYADAEQAQIQANFAEFLARAETMHPGAVIGAARDPETNEFEAIFIGSPVSLGTAEIVVEETEGSE